MTIRLLQSATALSMLAAPAISIAQTQTSANEDERLEALIRESEMVYVPKNQVQIGFRLMTSGAKVNFSNLGTIGYQNNPSSAAWADGETAKVYDNGTVVKDGWRTNEYKIKTNEDGTTELEKDADGNYVHVDTENGRYKTYSTTTADDGTTTTTQSGDYLAYQEGLTRSWSYAADSQVSNGVVAMSTYRASSTGGAFSKDAGASSGLDMQIARDFGRITKRIQWGVVAGVALSDINAKTSGDITSSLFRRTDYYNIRGTLTDGAKGGPSYTDLLDSEGNVLVTGGKETTAPIDDVPFQSDGEVAAGTTVVTGNWQIKGAYFMLRLGPRVNAQLTERINLNASAGFAAAYVGTTFSATETIKVPDADTYTVTTGLISSDVYKFLTGYYADAGVEWCANDRTGFFGGVLAQSFGAYDQKLGDRTARIDLGNSVGFRGGVSIKF